MMESTTSRWTERIAKAAMAGVLACGLMLPSVSMLAQPAWAEEANDAASAVQVNSSDTSAAYKAYKLFNANIDKANRDAATNMDAAATNITWAISGDALRALVTFLNDGTNNGAVTGASLDTTNPSPQDAAVYISKYIKESTNDDNAGTAIPTKQGATFASKLADKLAQAGSGVTSVELTAGTANATVTQGYWLIVSSATSLTEDDFGTAPIWAALSHDDTTANPYVITAKEASTTLNFYVRDDSNASSTDYTTESADANVNQDLQYRIVGTLPTNIAAYPEYRDTYVVTLPDHMAYAADASTIVAKVFTGGATPTEATLSEDKTITTAKSGTNNNILTITLPDLHGVEGLSGGSVVITFDAHLSDGSATMGDVGNEVSVLRTYTSSPVATGTSGAAYTYKTSTQSDTVKVYTYQVNGVKIDKGDANTKLGGASFVIQAFSYTADAGSGNAWYVKPSDGSLVAASATPADTWVTSTDKAADNTTELKDLVVTSAASTGELTIKGIDADTYVIKEIVAPTNYELQDGDITLNIKATVPGTINAHDAASDPSTISGGEISDAGNGANENLVSATVNSTDAGQIDIKIPDRMVIKMPLTGLPGYIGFTIIGLVLVVGGLGGLFFLRRARDRKQEL